MVEDLLKSLDISQRGDAATAISYEADALVLDPPVYGRVGYIPILVQEIQQAWINLDNIKKQFAEANIKVSSTETGVIFVNIVHETSNVDEGMVIVLNDIHIDIMDYISPASCADVAFRTMWAEFEWENKVAVNTVIQDEKEFLYHIVKSTNMKCLSPPSALEGECGFLAAKSVFGEDALVTLSIEKQGDGKLSGYIRIRSKTQGIALSLGDKITLKQKGGGSN